MKCSTWFQDFDIEASSTDSKTEYKHREKNNCFLTVESLKKKKPYKRTKNVDQNQKNVVKKARLLGHSYTSHGNKHVEARSLKPPCKCRVKCFEKISEDVRKNIFQHFWGESFGWQQRRKYILDRVKKTPKARTRVRSGGKERKHTYIYHLQVNGELIRVCKVMFLNTLCIREGYVKYSLDKYEESIKESGQRHKSSRTKP